jgi:hypothetical protein
MHSIDVLSIELCKEGIDAILVNFNTHGLDNLCDVVS